MGYSSADSPQAKAQARYEDGDVADFTLGDWTAVAAFRTAEMYDAQFGGPEKRAKPRTHEDARKCVDFIVSVGTLEVGRGVGLSRAAREMVQAGACEQVVEAVAGDY